MASTDDRTRPRRVRITGLQEQQLADLIALDHACAAQYHEIGFDAAEVPVRGAGDFSSLGRRNSVKVAEADHEVAGFMAWHDEAPGVAYLVDIQVHPDYQRFGVASALLDALREEARGHGFGHIVVRCWERAPWAMGFYKKQGFQRLDETAPEKVRGWQEEQAASGRPVTRRGETLLWVTIPPAPHADDDDEEEDDEPPVDPTEG